jgi:polar amino acid transport system substrate-binding protein
MKVGCALGIVLAAVVTVLPVRAGDWQEVQRRGVLRWGGDLQGGEPYVFEDPKQPGKIVGFELEIAEALGRRLGVRAEFRQNDWSNLVPSLERGDFDVVLNGLEDTPARRDRILLSLPYFVFGETLTVRKADAFRSLDELKGRKVGTLNQTVAHDLLLARGFEPVLYEGQQEPYFDLVQKRVDAILLDHVIADRYGCNLPELRCLAEDVVRGTYVIGIQKDHHELKRKIDGALTALSTDGELRAILARWKLWDERQSALAPASPSPPSAVPAASVRPLAIPAPSVPEPQIGRRPLSAAQLALFFEGALMALVISCGAFAVAFPFGVLLGIARLYGGRVTKFLATTYIEVFRGTPVLLQLYVLYFGLAPLVRLGPLTAAILGLGLNYAAYEAEVQRGALLSLPRGQGEAASALGLGRWQALRHVLLPQSLRGALPAVTNDFVALLKDSSLVSVITVVELTKRMTITAVENRDWLVPGLLCAALYFAMGFPLARLSLWLENRLVPVRA